MGSVNAEVRMSNFSRTGRERFEFGNQEARLETVFSSPLLNFDFILQTWPVRFIGDHDDVAALG
jgi:hypothetical protein